MTCLKIASFLQEDPSWLKAISMAGRKLEAYSWREWLREWKYRVDSIEVWSCCYVKIIPFICGFLECDNFPELDFCCFGNNRAGYELCAMAGGRGAVLLMNLAGSILRWVTDCRVYGLVCHEWELMFSLTFKVRTCGIILEVFLHCGTMSVGLSLHALGSL